MEQGGENRRGWAIISTSDSSIIRRQIADMSWSIVVMQRPTEVLIKPPFFSNFAFKGSRITLE